MTRREAAALIEDLVATHGRLCARAVDVMVRHRVRTEAVQAAMRAGLRRFAAAPPVLGDAGAWLDGVTP